MNKKGFRLAAVFLVVVFVYIYFFRNSEPSELAVRPVVEEETKTKPYQPVIKIQPKNTVPTKKESPTQGTNREQEVPTATGSDIVGRMPPALDDNESFFEVVEGGFVVTHGDILMGKVSDPKIKVGMIVKQPSPTRRYWPTNEIQYHVDKKSGFSSLVLNSILAATLEISDKTNVSFKVYDGSSKDYIVFTKGTEFCASFLGYQGGAQPVFLTEDCRSREIVHELMHALGFIHEQSRRDRDKYVKINWENILPGKETQFTMAPAQAFEDYHGSDFFFDYQSVMMYAGNSFSREPNLQSIESLTSEIIEPSSGLSELDARRLNAIYGR